MCSSIHRAPNEVHEFRMGIPADLCPFMAGKREIKCSLGLKDREVAKALISDMTKAAHTLLKQAERTSPLRYLLRQRTSGSGGNGHLRAVQGLLDHAKINSTVRYVGVGVGDALERSERTEV